MRAITQRFDHDPIGDPLMGELLSEFKTNSIIEANGPLIKSGYRQPRCRALKGGLCEVQYRLKNYCAKPSTG